MFNERKFTQGKWDHACDSYGKVRHSRKACVYTVAKREGGDEFVNIASRIPNWEDARLIAAAPDLFDACMGILSLVDKNGQVVAAYNSDQLRAVFEAVRKATGE